MRAQPKLFLLYCLGATLASCGIFPDRGQPGTTQSAPTFKSGGNESRSDPFNNWNVPTPSNPGQHPSFAYIQQTILKTKCDGCHSDSSAFAGLSVDSYQRVMISTYVKASDPTHSWLYAYISLGYMPVGGPLLSVDEVSDIYTWILNGASNN